MATTTAARSTRSPNSARRPLAPSSSSNRPPPRPSCTAFTRLERAASASCVFRADTRNGDALDETVARISPLGWHPIIQFDGREFEEHEAQLKRIKGNYIIDHTGKFLDPVAPDSAPMKAFIRLLERGNCYVKISAPYETSKTGAPYEDVNRIASALIKAAPERMLWASNWPHPGVSLDTYPSDAALLDRLGDLMPDESTRQATFVDNPARLYGW